MIVLHELPTQYHAAYRHLQRLAQYPRYLAACIFGSVATGQDTPASDLDIKVMVDSDNPCSNINHPPLHTTKKVDISFLSFAQLHEATEQEIAQGERQPLLANARLIFDKTGQLGRLIERAKAARPKPLTAADQQFIQFLIYHANDKAERHITTDPAAALLVMHTSFNDLLKLHYRIRGHWWVSSKWLLQDLRAWDPTLANLVEAFVATANSIDKFVLWSAIVEHVVEPLGGRQPIAANNCSCSVCQVDLVLLLDGGATSNE